MIDKLSLVTKDLDISSLKAQFGETVSTYRGTQQYNLCERVASKSGRHLFTVYSDPKLSTINPFKIDLNPAKQELNHKTLLNLLSSSMDISEAMIQRLDHAADMEIPIMEAFETVRVKNKRKVQVFGEYKDGWLTGYYAGTKNEIFTAYDKAHEQKTLAFPPGSFKKIKGATHKGVLTRFEIRQRYNKCPYRKLTELPFLLDYNPFKSLEVLKLKDEFKDGFEAFKKQNSLHGIQNLKAHLNKHNNFRRDCSRFFESSDLPARLTAIYRANLSQYFEGSDYEAC